MKHLRTRIGMILIAFVMMFNLLQPTGASALTEDEIRGYLNDLVEMNNDTYSLTMANLDGAKAELTAALKSAVSGLEAKIAALDARISEIPAGEKGEKGDKGDSGEQGPKGDKGDTGAQGPKGAELTLDGAFTAVSVFLIN